MIAYRERRIIQIEMHYRDELVKNWMLENIQANNGELKITHQEIADHWGCTHKTALAITHRLINARKIDAHKESDRAGYTYKAPKPEVAA